MESYNSTLPNTQTNRQDENIFQFNQIIYVQIIFIHSTTKNMFRSVTPLKVRLQVPELLGLLEIKWQNTTHSRDMTATILPISTSDHFINDRTNKTPANTDFTRLLRFILIICDVVLFGCYGFPIRTKNVEIDWLHASRNIYFILIDHLKDFHIHFELLQIYCSFIKVISVEHWYFF